MEENSKKELKEMQDKLWSEMSEGSRVRINNLYFDSLCYGDYCNMTAREYEKIFGKHNLVNFYEQKIDKFFKGLNKGSFSPEFIELGTAIEDFILEQMSTRLKSSFLFKNESGLEIEIEPLFSGRIGRPVYYFDEIEYEIKNPPDDKTKYLVESILKSLNGYYYGKEIKDEKILKNLRENF